MFGKWPTEKRIAALEGVLTSIKGKNVLDVGAAEGLLARACLAAGASSVDGLDIDVNRISRARSLCSNKARFFVVDLNSIPSILYDGTLGSAYDVVLYLGVHHHLVKSTRVALLHRLMELCSETLVLRTTLAAYQEDGLHMVMSEDNFELVRSAQDEVTVMGPLWVYTRL
jgi:2-polyprenyl-3-methyl-5-hydroxy-6-metoxy-1,4-benzoquinol methylase